MRSIFLALATIALMFLSVGADSEINFMFQGMIPQQKCPQCSQCPQISQTPCPVASPPAPCPLEAEVLSGATKTVQILHFNDMYDVEGVSGVGGVARAATIRNARPDSLLVFSGDCFFPSDLSSIFRGQQMVDTFNQMGITVAVAGNHEFDGGIEHAVSLFNQTNFPWLLANLVEPGTKTPIAGLKRTHVIQHGGIKIGFFGVASDWRYLTAVGGKADYIDVVTCGTELVAELKAQGVDLIVALTHSDNVDDDSLLSAVPDIDVLLGGHDHALFSSLHKNGIILWKSMSNLVYMGELNIAVVKGNPSKRVSMVRTNLISLDSSVAQDSVLNTTVSNFLNQLSSELDEVVGTVTVDLDALTASVRTKETNMGNYVADVYVDKVAKTIFNPTNTTVIAVVNGGSIRGNRVYPAGASFTKRNVKQTLQFGNALGAVRITGIVLREVLERSVTTFPTAGGQFLQISGFKYAFDSAKAVGSRVVSVSYPDDIPIGDDDVLILVSNSFVLAGGDSYFMLVGAEVVLDPANGQRDDTSLMEYITAHPEIGPVVEGRIVQLQSSRQEIRKLFEEHSLEVLEEELQLAREKRASL